MVDALGVAEPRRLTDRDRGYPHTLRWSPDGAKIAFTDETLTLYWVDVATGTVSTVDRAEVEPMDVGPEAKPISDFAWSPDSRWLAYSKIGRDQVSNLYVYSLEGRPGHQSVERAVQRLRARLHARRRAPAVRLQPSLRPDLRRLRVGDGLQERRRHLRSHSETGRGAAAAAALGRERGRPRQRGQGRRRASVVTGPDRPRRHHRADRGAAARRAATTASSRSAADAVHLDGDDGDFNRFEFRELPPRELIAFSFTDRDRRSLAEEVGDFALSDDGKHLIYRTDEGIGILDTEPGHEPNGSTRRRRDRDRDKPEAFDLDLTSLELRIDPRAEWKQVYREAWRIERDFFYDPNMHGLDWQAVGSRYGQFVGDLSCAQDLHFLIGELIGELSTSHTYIRVGDRRRQAPEVEIGMLGADWAAEAGRYRIAKIYRVPHWSRDVDPPLAGPGVDVREGDYLIAINGHELTTDTSIYSAFQGLADRQVRLTFSADPTGTNARDAVVVPLSSERTLRYLDWVERNRRVVDDASGGRIGYLHLPDTYVGSAIEFPAYYYSQTRKQGLLIDGRFNGGGLDPDIFLARLAKVPLSYWTRRYSEDQVTPVYVSRAHMALLTNRQAGSGGDELPHEFRQKGMGPVIGTRTWGGLVGVSTTFELMDGSRLTAPDYRIYSPEGQWVVENEGVTPDIVVELDPAEMARGWDAQLQKGIEVLLEAIEREPIVPPEHPPFPVLH